MSVAISPLFGLLEISSNKAEKIRYNWWNKNGYEGEIKKSLPEHNCSRFSRFKRIDHGETKLSINDTATVLMDIALHIHNESSLRNKISLLDKW